MPKRLKNYLANTTITALILGLILAVYEAIGPYLAGQYYNLIWWGIVVASAIILGVIIWRMVVGCQNGHLLDDGLDD